MTRQLKLGAFLMATGHHVAAWRHPQVPADAGLDFAHYKRLAQIAETAKFDALFLADSIAAPTGDIASRMARSDHFEPLTLLSALSVVTEHIGLIATATTSYNEPYHVARKFASLDHLSGGRAGWNLVTSDNAAEAQNFGRVEHLGHAERYSRAREFHQVVTGLWDSWEDDAFVRDKNSGTYYDPEKVHALEHVGEHFRVKGPLNVARSPQGQPVIVQAGSSETGRELAAQTAEVVFTAQTSLANAQAFYSDLKGRLSRYDRSADSLKIMPGVFVIVGQSESEALEKCETFQQLVEPEVLAQGPAFVFGSEQPTPLQFRHHALGEVLQATRQVRHQHIEAIRGALLKPLLQTVGNLHRRSHQAVMPAPTGNPATQFGEAEVLLAGQFRQQFLTALLPAFSQRQVG